MTTDSIHRTDLPAHALLRRYLREGHYADCYVVEVPIAVSQAEFVEAFYITPLFKLERLLAAVRARLAKTANSLNTHLALGCRPYAIFTPMCAPRPS